MSGIIIRPISRLYFRNVYRQCFNLQNKDYSTVSTNCQTTPALPWQIVGAACITRHPVVSPPMIDLEEEYSNFVEDLVHNDSIKSCHEILHEQETLKAELSKLNLDESSDLVDLGDSKEQNALEFEDACLNELKSHIFAPRLTDNDSTNNLASCNRSLDQSLFLVVNQKLGDHSVWTLPQTPWTPGETLRQTCERLSKLVCGSKSKVDFVGNAPCGFYKYKFSKNVQKKEGFIGTKVFFFKAQYLDHTASVETTKQDITEHQWLPREQMCVKFTDPSYNRAVDSFIL